MQQAHSDSGNRDVWRIHTHAHFYPSNYRIFTTLHHCCCREASSIVYTLRDSATLVCFHLNMQVCPSLYWSPLQGDAQWWTASYTEQRIKERQCVLWLWEEERRSWRPKGGVLNKVMGEIKSQAKKEFGKSKQIKQKKGWDEIGRDEHDTRTWGFHINIKNKSLMNGCQSTMQTSSGASVVFIYRARCHNSSISTQLNG